MKKAKTVFRAGDLIAVFGGEKDEKNEKAEDVEICKIIAVGEKDLMIEETKASYSTRRPYYVVPKEACIKLQIEAKTVINSRYLEPKLGDLVLSYVREVFKKEDPIEITGILYKIVYKFGRPLTATIIHDNEMKEVPFASLMVLQRN